MYDLDIDPMTLALEFDLDMVEMYHLTRNEVSVSTASKVISQTDRQTDAHTHTTKALPLPHTREVKMNMNSPNYLKNVGDTSLATRTALPNHS